jgi:hypothetical protein
LLCYYQRLVLTEKLIVNILRLKYSKVLATLIVLFGVATFFRADQPRQNDGKLVVIVTWGDVDNTPATNVIVEVVGHALPGSWGKTVLLKASKDGQYEVSLEPGIYDVFVSEPGSMPRCRRLAIKPKSPMYWTLKLEIDDVYHRSDVF